MSSIDSNKFNAAIVGLPQKTFHTYKRDPKGKIITRSVTPVPEEVTISIFGFLPFHGVLAVSQVNKIWNRLTNDPLIWKCLNERAHFKKPIGDAQFSQKDYRLNLEKSFKAVVQIIHHHCLQVEIPKLWERLEKDFDDANVPLYERGRMQRRITEETKNKFLQSFKVELNRINVASPETQKKLYKSIEDTAKKLIKNSILSTLVLKGDPNNHQAQVVYSLVVRSGSIFHLENLLAQNRAVFPSEVVLNGANIWHTPFSSAVTYQNYDMLEYLVTHTKFEPNQATGLVSQAVHQGDPKSLEILLKAGAPVHAYVFIQLFNDFSSISNNAYIFSVLYDEATKNKKLPIAWDKYKNEVLNLSAKAGEVSITELTTGTVTKLNFRNRLIESKLLYPELQRAKSSADSKNT